MLFLFGNDRGFSYDALSAIVKTLYNTAFY